MSVYIKYFTHLNSLSDYWTRFIQCQRAFVMGIFIVSSSLLVFPDVAISENIKSMTYRNEGGYQARFYVRWTTPAGVTCAGYKSLDYTSSTAKTVSFHLGGFFQKLNQLSQNDACKKYVQWSGEIRIAEGSRVWGVVDIKSGQMKSCKGTKAVYFYDKLTSGDIKYKTRGTTQNNNRCFHTN